MNLIWIVGITFAILTFANIYYVLYVRSLLKRNTQLSKDDLYYRLDAKIDLLKYLAIGFISVAGLFGFTRLSDLSEDYREIETLTSQFQLLNNEYSGLQQQYDDLNAKTKYITDQYERLLESKHEIDLEFFKINDKLEDVTREIPEENIKMLTRLLVKTNLRDAGVSYVVATDSDVKEMQEAINLSRRMLKSIGYSESEIEEFIKEEINNNKVLRWHRKELQ